MAHIPTGGQQRLAQHSTADLSGGVASDQFVTTTSIAKVNGNVAVWQDGLLIDSGISLAILRTHTEVLTDSHGPILESDGDLIYVFGVPG